MTLRNIESTTDRANEKGREVEKSEREKKNPKEAFPRKRKLTSFDIWFYRKLKRCLKKKVTPSNERSITHTHTQKKLRVYFESFRYEKFLMIIFKQKHTNAWKLKIMRAHPLQFETKQRKRKKNTTYVLLWRLGLSGKNEFCYILCAIGIVRPFLASVCSHYGIHNI